MLYSSDDRYSLSTQLIDLNVVTLSTMHKLWGAPPFNILLDYQSRSNSKHNKIIEIFNLVL